MNATPDQVAEAVELLRLGDLVAFPTETVYGLGADAFRASAVRKVFECKGRPPENPLLVHVAGVEMARRCVSSWPEGATRLAEAFWPGPLSILLPRAPDLPDAVTSGALRVGLRCPRHPLTLALLESFGGPLVGPSANRSGMLSPTTPSHVRGAFPDLFVLDGGACVGGIESTVVRLDEDGATVLRPGLVTPPEIESVLGGPVRERATSEAIESPGLLGAHYAPRTRLRVVDEVTEASGRVVLTFGALRAERVIEMPREARAYAARLYEALHEADAMGMTEILVERPPTDDPIWRSVMDRLERASI